MLLILNCRSFNSFNNDKNFIKKFEKLIKTVKIITMSCEGIGFKTMEKTLFCLINMLTVSLKGE